MSKLKEYMEEQFKRYQEIHDLKALAAALEAAKQKYTEEMDKVCYSKTLSSSSHFPSNSLFLLLCL